MLSLFWEGKPFAVFRYMVLKIKKKSPKIKHRYQVPWLLWSVGYKKKMKTHISKTTTKRNVKSSATKSWSMWTPRRRLLFFFVSYFFQSWISSIYCNFSPVILNSHAGRDAQITDTGFWFKSPTSCSKVIIMYFLGFFFWFFFAITGWLVLPAVEWMNK